MRYVDWNSTLGAVPELIYITNTSDKNVSMNRFYEMLEDKTKGISALNKQIYELSSDIYIPGKSALVLDVK